MRNPLYALALCISLCTGVEGFVTSGFPTQHRLRLQNPDFKRLCVCKPRLQEARARSFPSLARDVKLSSTSQQQEWEQFVLDLQKDICETAEAADGQAKFCVDRWDRGVGKGYGITRVLEGGRLWEKAACSVSVVRGELTKERAAAMSARGQAVSANQPYFAAACSLVFHSASPMVPTFRSDVRYFKVGDNDGWYGGGADLTPYYLFEEVSVLELKKQEIWNLGHSRGFHSRGNG